MNQSYARDMNTIATQAGYPELGTEAILRGLSPRELRDGLRRLREASRGYGDSLGFGRDQLESFSISRAIGSLLGDVKGQTLEREVSDAIARSLPSDYKPNGGIFVPMAASIGERTALTSSTSGAASQLVFSKPGTIIELLRSRMVTTRMGATFMPGLTGPVGFPRQTASGTAYWVSENPTNDVTESNLSVDLVTLSPKTIQATQSVTRQLIAQASSAADKMIGDDMVNLHARKWDKAALHGAGGAEPTGIYGASGVNSVAIGATSTAWYAKLADMATEVALDDADVDSMGYVTTPGFAGKLMQTLDFATASAGLAIWRGKHSDGILCGYPAIASTQVSSTLGASSNEHGVLFGNWQDLLIGTWGVLELIVDPYAKKKKGIIELTSFQLVDIPVRHGQSFCKGTGAKIS